MFWHSLLLVARFKFVLYKLHDQNRCTDDKDHQNLITKMRNLEAKNPITENMIKQLKIIKKSDLDDNPEWSFAPIIVTSNKTRHRINRKQIKRFATFYNKKIFRWLCPVQESMIIHEAGDTKKTISRTRTIFCTWSTLRSWRKYLP